MQVARPPWPRNHCRAIWLTRPFRHNGAPHENGLPVHPRQAVSSALGRNRQLVVILAVLDANESSDSSNIGVWNYSDMNFLLVMIPLAVVPGIVGALLAHRYSVYALVPTSLFFLVQVTAGCLADRSSLLAITLAVLCSLTCLQFGYFLRIFVSQTERRPSAISFGLTQAQPDERR
jgi:hypothetical protein